MKLFCFPMANYKFICYSPPPMRNFKKLQFDSGIFWSNTKCWFFFQYLEVSFDNQKYLWMRVLLWKFGPLERKMVSGTEDWPWRNLNYIILLSGRLCSVTVYMLLDKLLGSVDNQSVSTGSHLSLTTRSWSRDREHSRSHTFLDRDGIKQLLFKSYTPSTSPSSAKGFK